MIKTCDRRKTFNTPLEFWRWAIEDSMRQAQNSIGHRFMVQVSPSTGAVIPWRAIGLQGGAFGPTDSDCPLTAVEDEHGVIEEEKPIDLPLLTNSAGYVLYLAMQSGASDESQQRNIQLALSYLLQEAARIADERIAAAVIERQEMVDFPFRRLSNYRLKPKGE